MAQAGSKPQFNFMLLPRELRDHIYDHIVTSTYGVDISPVLGYWETSRPGYRKSARKSRPPSIRPPEWETRYGQYPSGPSNLKDKASRRLAILRVSKTVCEEATRVLYKNSTFHFLIDHYDKRLAKHFERLQHIDLMKHIKISITMNGWGNSDARPLREITRALIRRLSETKTTRHSAEIVISARQWRGLNKWLLAEGIPFRGFKEVTVQIIGDRLRYVVPLPYDIITETLEDWQIGFSQNLGPCITNQLADEHWELKFYPLKALGRLDDDVWELTQKGIETSLLSLGVLANDLFMGW